MVHGLDRFQSYFRGFEDQYVIIGGTACDLLMSDEGFDFRATKDIDMVLIMETITPEFGKRLWRFIIEGGYEHRKRGTDLPQFYRFSHPTDPAFPQTEDGTSDAMSADPSAYPPEYAPETATSPASPNVSPETPNGTPEVSQDGADAPVPENAFPDGPNQVPQQNETPETPNDPQSENIPMGGYPKSPYF